MLVYSFFDDIADRMERGAADAVESTANHVRDAIRERIELLGLIDTRNYYNSWRVVPGSHPYEYLVISDVEYGPRLLYGFMDVDSLGRHFNQPARPHVQGPTEDQLSYLLKSVSATMRVS